MPPISLTDAAARQIRRVSGADGIVRLDLERGGCAGMEYRMTREDAPRHGDLVVEDGPARLAIAPRAEMFLIGTVIDYSEGLLESGFRFDNPNVASQCGCGESVGFATGGSQSAARINRSPHASPG